MTRVLLCRVLSLRGNSRSDAQLLSVNTARAVRLEWAPLAIADRESIFDYIAPENLDAALALDELFERKAALLGAHPEAGRVGRVRDTRELSWRRWQAQCRAMRRWRT
jgi:plasmid stabilization system protein ParE